MAPFAFLLLSLPPCEPIARAERPLYGLYQVLSGSIPQIISQLKQSLPAKNIWHHPGYRYRLTDQSLGLVRCGFQFCSWEGRLWPFIFTR